MHLLAVEVQLDLGTILFLGGAVALAIGFLLGTATSNGKWLCIGGVVLLVCGYFATTINSAPSPAPAPPSPYGPYGPTPLPTPTPPPLYFGTEVAQAFKEDSGRTEDAPILAAAFIQMSESLMFDGELGDNSRINNLNDLGNSFARLQRSRFLMQDTPMRDRYPKVQMRMASEMTSRGLKDGNFDRNKRSAAAAIFREAGDALSKVK